MTSSPVRRLIVSRDAKRDLKEQRAYIAQEKPHAARRFARAFTDKFKAIVDLNLSGSSRDEYRAGLRGLPLYGRTICFTVTGAEVRIVRVIHDARDVSPDDFA